MIKYKTTGIVNISHGHVALDEDQARRRKLNIVEVDEGVYKVIRPIQFKIGETFGSDIEVNRALAVDLTVVDKPVVEDEPKKKRGRPAKNDT